MKKAAAICIVLLGLVLSATFVRQARLHPGTVSSDAAVFDGIAAEVLAGTTPGRQAMVGSALWGPLPILLDTAAHAVADPFTESRTASEIGRAHV